MAWKGPKASHSITGGGAHVLGWGVSMAPGAAGAPRGDEGTEGRGAERGEREEGWQEGAGAPPRPGWGCGG